MMIIVIYLFICLSVMSSFSKSLLILVAVLIITAGLSPCTHAVHSHQMAPPRNPLSKGLWSDIKKIAAQPKVVGVDTETA